MNVTQIAKLFKFYAVGLLNKLILLNENAFLDEIRFFSFTLKE